MNDQDKCKRRFERVERSLITHYSKADADEIERAGLAQNLSFGGLWVEIDEELTEGDLLDFEIKLNELEPAIQARGRVVRTGKDGAGIEFVEIGDADRLKLMAYLQERYESAADPEQS